MVAKPTKKAPAKKRPVKKAASKKAPAKKRPVKKAVSKKAAAKKTTLKKAGRPGKAKPTKPRDSWLTQSQMSRSLRISMSAFRLWGVEPVATIGPRKFYCAADVVANRQEHWKAHQEKLISAGVDQRVNQVERRSKLRLIKAQAEGQELKNEQLRREVAPVKILEWVLGRAGAQISAILAALPATLKKRNRKLTAANIETIRREIVKAQNVAATMTIDIDEYQDSGESGPQ